MSQPESSRTAAAEVVVKAWRDVAYRERLMRDPAAVLEEAGLRLPASRRVTVLENTGSVWHIVVPALEELGATKGEVLAELDRLLPLPAGVELRLHQSSADERFFVLPLPPAAGDKLGEEELAAVHGAGSGGNGGAGGCGFLYGNGGNGGDGFLGNGGNGGYC